MTMGLASMALLGGSAVVCGAGAALALPAAVDALLARKRRKWLAWFDERMCAWEAFCAQNGRQPDRRGDAGEQALCVWADDARRLAGSDVLGPERAYRVATLGLPDPDAALRATLSQAAGAAEAQARATAAACVPAAFKNGGQR